MTNEPRLTRSANINISPIADEWEWQYQGACRNADPESFFLEYKLRGSSKRNKEKAAVAVCNTCPVKAACLAHALKVPEFFGVWGGTTEEERRLMIKGRGGTWL